VFIKHNSVQVNDPPNAVYMYMFIHVHVYMYVYKYVYSTDQWKGKRYMC